MDLKSSHIQSRTYDPQTQEMRVTFKNGATYRFPNVPAAAYAQFERASSPGKHFHRFIKGAFQGRKM